MTIVVDGTAGITFPNSTTQTGAVSQPTAPFSANGLVYATSTSALTTGNALVFNGTNLGIGTSSPAQILSLYTNLGTGTGVGTSISMVADGSGGDQGYIGINKGSGNGFTFGEQNRDFIWQTGNSTPFNGTERMRLTNAGNLGLGTTAPVSLLNVFFNASTRNGITVTNAYEPGAPAYIAFKGYDWVRSAVWHDRSSGLPLQFAINPNTTDLTINGCVVAASFDTSGNLLVGTTSGSNRITVSAANGTTAVVGVNNTTSGNAAGYSSSLQTAANNTSSYHYYGSTLAVGNWYLYGNGTSSWSSDERLKHNIQTTRDGYLEDVCKLRVVKYQWKNGPQQTELGLIAQEVEQVFPGLVQDDLNPVHPDDPTLYKQLKGSVLPMILLKAIQELSAELNALKAKIEV